MKNKIYDTLFRENSYEKWSEFDKRCSEFEAKVSTLFEEDVELKLVGSASTRSMLVEREDMDYFVAFDREYNKDEFVARVSESNLEITGRSFHRKFGYLRLTGNYKDTEFVLVPVINPRGNIETYEQDAFYHPDFINNLKGENHTYETILSKLFFKKTGVYKRVKGIGTELLQLHHGSFEEMLNAFCKNDSMRINFSPINTSYSSAKLIVDYPFLGGRSFTEKVTSEDYGAIKELAEKVLKNHRNLI